MARRRVPRTGNPQETVPEPANVAPVQKEKNTQPRDNNAQLAPFPIGDEQQKVMGSDVTLEYISMVFRESMGGIRRNYVDLLDELTERDPHAYGVLFQRMLGALAGKIIVEPPEDLPEGKKARAKLMAQFVKTRLDRIRKFKGSLLELLYHSNLWGVGCQEITWGEEQGTGFRVPMRLHMVHSRRVEYPFFDSWDAYIVDNNLGAVVDNMWRKASKERAYDVRQYGIRIDDFYGKFVLHVSRLRASYPTREGLGRQIAFWLCIKSMAIRSGALLIERFAVPFCLAYLNTIADEKHPRVASERDGLVAQAVLSALASGKTAKALLPDSVKLEFEQVLASSGKMPVVEFLRYIDAQIAKAVVGTSELSDDDTSGNKGRAEVVQDFILALLQYDADMLAETLQECLINPMVEYNFPDDLALTPKLKLTVERTPSFEQLFFYSQSAEILGNLGANMDMQSLAERLLIKLDKSSPTKTMNIEDTTKITESTKAENAIRVEKSKPKPKPANKSVAKKPVKK
jgi:phage gp29-like protein